MPAMQLPIFLLIALVVLGACIGVCVALMLGVMAVLMSIFQKSPSSHRSVALRIVLPIIVGVGCGIGLSITIFAYVLSDEPRQHHSPEKAFFMVFGKDAPKSVTIRTYSHTSTFDEENVSLHFTIDPRDLSVLIDLTSYDTSENWLCSAAQETQGWQSYVFHTDVHRRYFCISPTSDEVYGEAEERLW